MVNFVHPFLPPLNSVWTGVFLHHSYRCLLSNLEFSQSIKHGILVESVLGGSLMLTRFSQWEQIDTFKCENRTENRPQVLTWSRTGSNIYFVFPEKRTGSLIKLRSGSHSSLYHLLVPLVLLLTWDCYSSSCCYYFSPIIILLSLLLLLFSHCSYSFPVTIFFSHGVALFVWWSHLIIITII
jgi:hypothetical protein